MRDAKRTLRFYAARRNRYWKRPANQIARIVERFSTQPFGKALGQHGETMIDAALPRRGFMPLARKVRAWNGISWSETGHDLDRVFSRDGVHYGTEIKNTLDYIPRDELDAKIAMCRHLGLSPLFIVRMAPATYINDVRKAGGFTLVLEYQLYPFHEELFAREVKNVLRLPVDCPTSLYDGTLDRLLAGHVKIVNSDRNSHA